MTDIQIFNNPQFGKVRVTATENGDPMFCLSDVCKVLELSNPSQVKTRLNPKGVHTVGLNAINNNEGVIINELGNRLATFINEANLYKCIFQSRKPEAEKFQDWIFEEVIPSIRKHGGYIVANEDDTAEELMARALLVAQKTLERRDERIRLLEAVNTEQAKAISEMSPKATYYNIILQSPSTVTVTQVAQDYGMSAKAFNKLLHTLGIQRKVGRQWVLYSEYISNGYVQSATEPMKNSHSGRSYTYSRWTQKGRIFLYNELKNRGVLPLIEKAA